MRIDQRICAFLAALSLAGTVNAGIISSGVITGSNGGASNRLGYTALGGSDTRILGPGMGPVSFNDAQSRHTGITATDGIKLRLEDVNGESTFSTTFAGLVDTYTVVGGTPGATLAFNALFHFDGTSTRTPGVGGFFGESAVTAVAGLGISYDPTEGHGAVTILNPVIDAPLGRAVVSLNPIPIGTGAASATFDHTLVVPLMVTEGTPFDLSFGVQIGHTGYLDTNMLSTATVTFDLPTGTTISSVNGFGTTPTTVVPEPGTFAMAFIGLVSCAGLSRLRRNRSS